MNLRTLKKLSKRAAPLLPLLGDDRKQFPAGKYDSYHGLLISARKHFERMRSCHDDCLFEDEIKTPAKDGNGWVRMAPPRTARKGTIMVGAMSGYYEPEWDEESAWRALMEMVHVHFTDWSAAEPACVRRLRTPSEILKAAQDMAAELSAPRGFEA